MCLAQIGKLALFFTIAKQEGSTSANINSGKWFTIDPVNPVSFRRYNIQIHAEGNNTPFGGQGAWLRLENVGIKLISSSATYEDRFNAKCDLPAGP